MSCHNNLQFNLKTGDLLFQDLDSSPLCDAIEKVTSGYKNLPISHIGIVLKENNKTYVIEAYEGVDTITIEKFLDRNKYNGHPKVFVGRLKTKHNHLIPKAIDRGIQLIGKKYDEEFAPDNDKFYCSELIYEMFMYSNENLPFFKLKPMTYKFQGKTLEVWSDYFDKLNIEIPENKLGINPACISLSDKIEIIYNYNLPS